MSNVWDEFDKNIDVEGLKEDAQAAAEGNQEFKEVPFDNYEISIEKLELVKAKSSGNPMVSGWFKIIDGDFKGQRIFYNQVIHIGFGLHLCKEFLKSLDTKQDIDFVSYAQFAGLLEAVKTETDAMEYVLAYGEDSKGYKTFEITDVFEVESDV